jgi:phosphoenolpyruvate synthase/pyruvate phosphate dikinase
MKEDVMNGTRYVEPVEQAGFVTTESAYRDFVAAARLRPLIATQVRRLREGGDLLAISARIRTAFFDAQLPAELTAALEEAYERLGGPGTEVVVGGVATGDQLDEFLTGPHEIFFGVKGERALLAAVKRCWGSLFTDRAIIYREVRDIDHLFVGLTVRIEPMPTAPTAKTVLESASAG